MKAVICLGNGESRKVVDLEQLRRYKHPMYGCNAIYRDFVPDAIVAVDNKMMDEIDDICFNGCPVWTVFYKNEDRQVYLIRKPGFNIKIPGMWASGPASIFLSLHENPMTDVVFLLGHDLAGIGGQFNNMYKGTKNYQSPLHAGQVTSAWQDQILQLCGMNKSKTFYRCGFEYIEPDRIQKNLPPNFHSITIDQMWQLLEEEYTE